MDEGRRCSTLNLIERRVMDCGIYLHGETLVQSHNMGFRILQRRMQILRDPSSSVLDFGCGCGQLSLAQKKVGYLSVEGADISQRTLHSLACEGSTIHAPGEKARYRVDRFRGSSSCWPQVNSNRYDNWGPA